MDSGLRTGEGLCGNTQLVDRHGQKGHRNTLAGGEKDVHLTLGCVVSNLRGGVQELVGCVAHC